MYVSVKLLSNSRVAPKSSSATWRENSRNKLIRTKTQRNVHVLVFSLHKFDFLSLFFGALLHWVRTLQKLWTIFGVLVSNFEKSTTVKQRNWPCEFVGRRRSWTSLDPSAWIWTQKALGGTKSKSAHKSGRGVETVVVLVNSDLLMHLLEVKGAASPSTPQRGPLLWQNTSR